MATNVKQSDIMMFLTDRFNQNSLNIPFKQGFYTSDNPKDFNVVWYKPRLNDNGLFDIENTFDSETYAVNKKRFIVMQTDVSSGDYTGLPNVQMVSFTSNVEVMVYADDPLILLTTKMAIEEVRDSFIGKDFLHTISGFNDLGNRVNETIKIVTTAGGVDYGNEVIIKGRKFLIMSLVIELTVSKNIEFGNQIEYEIGVVNNETNEVGEMVEIIPLISSWAVSQEMQGEQMLRGFSVEIQEKARQIHNYIKARGWGITFTFLLDLSNPIIRDFWKESINAPDLPTIYVIKEKMKEYDKETKKWIYPEDLKFERRVVYGEVAPSEIVRGEPIMFSIGFSLSAK